MLKSINLSLSASCGANCIYCHENRGRGIQQKFMSFELAKKIVDEISSENFRKKHQVSKMQVGENGDAFLNKDIIKILRYIKLKLPYVETGVFTNFQHLTEDKAQVILAESLIDKFACNIDASNKENFAIVKGLDLDVVEKNLADFLKVRTKLKKETPLTIAVLALNDYIGAVRYCLGSYPVRLRDRKLTRAKSEFDFIKKRWESFLDLKKDSIIRSGAFFWAERDAVNHRMLVYKRYSCPNLNQIKEEAFIASDGIWYACCFDSDNYLVLGDVNKDSLETIYSGRARENLIELLEKKEFEKIGGPCRTVNCCQGFVFNEIDIINRVKGLMWSKAPSLYRLARHARSKTIAGKRG